MTALFGVQYNLIIAKTYTMTIFHRNIKGAQVQQNTMNSAETGMDPTANSITELLQEEL